MITVSGTVVSLAPTSTDIVIGSTMEALAAGPGREAPAVTSFNVRGVVQSVFGGGAIGSSGSGGSSATGTAVGFASGPASVRYVELEKCLKLECLLAVMMTVLI